MLAVLVLAAVNFDNQAFFQTHEIQYITAERVLATKLQAVDLRTTQSLPQAFFGLCRILSQIAAELAMIAGTVILALHVTMPAYPFPAPFGGASRYASTQSSG